MPLRIRHIDPDATPGSHISLEALARVLRPEILSEVIDECQAHERRTRKLPAVAVVVVCVAMNLYAGDCLVHVFFRLVSGLRWLLTDPGEWRVSKGALCQARYRLGAPPLVALFKKVCANKPLADPETEPDAFLFGLRLMALDSTVLDLPDTPENVRAFGKRRSPRGESAWPQARVVAISECWTHAVCEAGVWRHDFDERAAAPAPAAPRGAGGAADLGPRPPLLRPGRSRPRPRRALSRTRARQREARGRPDLSDGTQLVRCPVRVGRRRGGSTCGALPHLHPGRPGPPGDSARASPAHLAAQPARGPGRGAGRGLPRPLGGRVAFDELETHQLPAPPPCAAGSRWASSRRSTACCWPTTSCAPSWWRGARGALAPTRLSFPTTLGISADRPRAPAHGPRRPPAALPPAVGRPRRGPFPPRANPDLPPGGQKEDVELRGQRATPSTMAPADEAISRGSRPP